LADKGVPKGFWGYAWFGCPWTLLSTEDIGGEDIMARKFIFIKDVEQLIGEGKKEVVVPEGTRLSPAAADLIKEKGIHLAFAGEGAGPSSTKRENKETPPEGSPSTPAKGSTASQATVAVASSGKTPADNIGNVAARSPYFLFFDSQGKLLEVLENPHRDVGGRAGPLVADFMAEKGVTSVVAGNFGQNIVDSLDKKGIQHIALSGPVEKALEAISG
jgi:predicted Fe-Mo cluster-binding NifX family protein